jgi:hypothetical protein
VCELGASRALLPRDLADFANGPALARGRRMGFLDSILQMFGKLDYGKLGPDDLENYWRADHDIDQGERAGEAQLAAAFAKWGMRDAAHWEKVEEAILAKHNQNPELAMACSRVGFERAMASISNTYQMPPEYATPPHGITLDRYAAIRARLDLGHPLGTVLAESHLDLQRWNEVERTWAWRMGPQADAMAANILGSSYMGMHQQALAAYRRS